MTTSSSTSVKPRRGFPNERFIDNLLKPHPTVCRPLHEQ
jgi:hypothetical protein